MEQNPKICKRCLLRDLAVEDQQNIAYYIAAIKESERVPSDAYEARLSVCKQCSQLNSGTCNACGCYVELRALSKNGRCPYKKW